MKITEPQMVSIPEGELVMGAPACPPNANFAQRWHSGARVRIAAFQLGRCAVTNQEYAQFVADAGAERPITLDKSGFDALNQPVGGVSWEDATAYCRWLAKQTGRPYRLPRDAEWEYAARGGRAEAPFPWGDALGPAQACFGGVAAPRPVASYPPNGYGLFDMIGNVWQWCEERFEDVSNGVKAVNRPTGKDAAVNRVLRGGSYLTTNYLNLWVAYRHDDPPDLRHECLGFRVAL